MDTNAVYEAIQEDNDGNICLKVKLDDHTEVSSVLLVSSQELSNYRVGDISLAISYVDQSFKSNCDLQRRMKLEFANNQQPVQIVGDIRNFFVAIRDHFGIPTIGENKFQLLVSGEVEESKSDKDVDDSENPTHWKDTNVVDWSSAHVQAWMQTLGNRISSLSSNFAHISGTRLLLFECKEDLAALMPNATRTTTKTFFRKICELKTYCVDVHKVQSIKREKKSGIVGLQNLGNTCFMNGSIQVLLQTPHLTSYLKNYAGNICNDDGNNNNNNNGGQRRTKGRKRQKKNNAGTSMLSAVSQLVLHGRNNNSQNRWSYNPSAIYFALNTTGPHLCDGGQHDSFDSLSAILDALDDDIHEHIFKMYDKPKLIMEEKNLTFADDAQEKMFIDQMFRNFNPKQSAVRSAMNGILRKIRTCYSCSKRSVSYVTFGSLILPIVKQKVIKKSIDIWLISDEQITNGDYNCNDNNGDIDNNGTYAITKTMTVKVGILPNDCSVVVKTRIFDRLIEEEVLTKTDSHAYEMQIGNICVGNNNNEQWVQYFDDDGQACNLHAMRNPFIVLQKNTRDLRLCNIIQFVVIVNRKTNQFEYKYHQLLSFTHKQVFTGSDLLNIVGRSVGKQSMNLKILMNGEFVEDGESYTMDADCVLCLVAVLVPVSEPYNGHNGRGWINYNPSDVDSFLYDYERLRYASLKNMLKSIKTRIDNYSRTEVVKQGMKNAHATVAVIKATYKALLAIYNNQERIRDALRGFHFRTTNTTITNMKLKTIGNCLKEYFAEHLQYLPTVCTCFSNVYRCSTSIAYAPTNLFIKLERSVMRDQKNEAFVEYSETEPLSIEMTSNSINSEQNCSRQEYDLYGVCCHVGLTQSGHCFAHVKSLQNGRWYTANDESVRETRNVVDRRAIVLLYTKH